MTEPAPTDQEHQLQRIRAALTGKAGLRAILSLGVMTFAFLYPAATTQLILTVAGLALAAVGAQGAWLSSRRRPTPWGEIGRDLIVLGVGVGFFWFRANSPETLLLLLVAALAGRGLLRLWGVTRIPDLRRDPWVYMAPVGEILTAVLVLIMPEVLSLVGIAFAVFWLLMGIVNLTRAFNDPDADAASLAESGAVVLDYLRERDVGEATRAKVEEGLFFEGAFWATRTWRFVALMGFSTAIATFGIASDSTAVVIGAMLIAPLMTPILGSAASIVSGWTRRFLSSMLLVGFGVAVAVTVSYVFAGWVTDFINPGSNSQITSRVAPTIIDLAIAISAGAAGAYANARRDVSDSLPGVAIAVALVPPLSVVGTTLRLGETNLALGAFLLFVTNLVGIIVAASALFFLLGLTPWNRVEGDKSTVLRSFLTAVMALGLIAIPLTLTGEELLTSASNQAAVESLVGEAIEDTPYQMVRVNLFPSSVEIVLTGPIESGSLDGEDLATDIAAQVGREVRIEIRVIPEERFLFNVTPVDDPG